MQKLKINKLLKIFFVMVTVLSFVKSDGQQIFHKGYTVSGTTGKDIVLLNNGYLALGRTGSGVVLIRTDFNGNVIWDKSYHNSQYTSKVINNAALQIINGDTSIVFSGNAAYQGVPNRIFSFKTDLQGSVIWWYYYLDQPINQVDYFSKDLKVVNYSVYITGYKHNVQTNDDSMFLLCLNFNGTINWIKEYGSPYSSSALSIINVNNDKLILLGSTNQTSDGTVDALFMKVNLDGIPEQVLTFNGFLDEGLFDGKLYDNDELILAGNTNSFNMLYLIPFLIKVDSVGGIKWGKVYDYNFHGSSMVANEDKVLITAHPFPNILVLDTAGVIEESYYTGGFVSYGMPHARLTPDGGFITVSTMDINSMSHLYLFKTDSFLQAACYSNTYSINEYNWVPTVTTINISFDTLMLEIDSGNINISPIPLVTYTLCSTSTDTEFSTNINNVNFLFPNPAQELIYINLPYKESKYSVQIIDLLGKIVYIGNLNTEETSINIANLKSGYYFLKITTEKKVSQVLKFIKTE
jgi:hypothetical protein